jgi:predicted dehydrogenase
MTKVGIVGIGFMGMIHFLSYRRVKGAKVVAICEQDKTRLAGDWRSIKGNFGPQGEMMDLAGIERYQSIDDLVADKNVELVDICLPTAAHPATAIKALAAGKHVFCEKPIALTTTDAKKMVAAAEKARKQLAIGHVLPYFAEFGFVLKAATSKKYGKLLGGSFKRITADPLWLKNYYDPKIIGGPLLDLHIHDAHFIRLLFGMPQAVFSVGRMRGEVVEFFNSTFVYPDRSLAVTATSGAINQQGRSFTHAFEVHFEKATVIYDMAVVDGKAELPTPLTVLRHDGKVERPPLAAGDATDAYVAEIQEVLKCIRSGKPSGILSGDLARDAVVLCQKQAESVASGRLVKV